MGDRSGLQASRSSAKTHFKARLLYHVESVAWHCLAESFSKVLQNVVKSFIQSLYNYVCFQVVVPEGSKATGRGPQLQFLNELSASKHIQYLLRNME